MQKDFSAPLPGGQATSEILMAAAQYMNRYGLKDPDCQYALHWMLSYFYQRGRIEGAATREP